MLHNFILCVLLKAKQTKATERKRGGGGRVKEKEKGEAEGETQNGMQMTRIEIKDQRGRSVAGYSSRYLSRAIRRR